MIDQRFGRWVIIAPAEPKTFPYNPGKQFRQWLCRCDCGTERPVLEGALRQGISQSCGCWNRERSSEVHTKHGATVSHDPEYDAWRAMWDRCRNSNNPRYADYGGRGITVDPRWEDYTVFLADVGRRPSPQHSIDRRDNDGHYEPGNCRWATPQEQMINRRMTVMVGEVPLAMLARQHGIPANTLRFRILKGWDLNDALTRPVRPKRK